MTSKSSFFLALVTIVALTSIPGRTMAVDNDDDDEIKERAYFYDHLVQVELKEEHPKPPKPSEDSELNTIYRSSALVNGQPFIDVIGILPEDEFEGHCLEVDLHFTVQPYQLTSEQAIEEAVRRGDITLQVTERVFRC